MAGEGARNRRKGDQFERDVVAYARAHGLPHAERAYGAGRPDDVGDLELVVGFVTSCKNEKRIELAEFLDEVEHQRRRAGARYAVVIVKRRGRSVDQSYVVQSLEQFCEREGEEHVCGTCGEACHLGR